MAASESTHDRGGVRLRVAVVAYTEYPWDPRVRRESESLARDGSTVHVISVRPRSGASPAHLGGVHVHEVPLVTRRGSRLRYAFQYAMFFFLSGALLMRLHLRQPFDIVHIHSLPDFQVFCALPLRLAGIPVLLDLHEAMPEILSARFRISTGAPLPRLAAVLEGLSCRFANHVITANDGIRSAVISRGVPEGHVTSVYNGSDTPIEVPSREELIREISLPDARLVVHAGGINRERDLETVFRAVSRLHDHRDVHIVLAGDGERGYLEELHRLVEDLGIHERVHFVGRIPLAQAYGLMALSEVGLVSLEENPLTELAWPVRITEFAGLKKPLIVPRLRFIHSVLGNGAHYYTPGDPASLAQALEITLGRRASDDPTVAVAERACSRFTWSQMREVLLGIYQRTEAAHAG